MNNGKICISICAKTSEECLEKVKLAERDADVLEVRFDCLEHAEIEKVFSDLKSKKPLIITYRPKEQGGEADCDMDARVSFWIGYAKKGSPDERGHWIDNETDLKPFLNWSAEMPVIRSFHDVRGEGDVRKVYDSIDTGCEIPKLAVATKDITDSIGVWKLLQEARGKGDPLIPIAMGEAGKWTRILGPAHGAFMTYAALEAGSETAAGQLTASDLIDVFRVKELDENTDVYGIVAGNTSYSLSPWMHNAAFEARGMNSVFVPLQVADLEAFIRRLVHTKTREIDLNFKGFSVTNPHKQGILQHLDEVDDAAKDIGAVNTVKIENGKLCGYNTDVAGFITPLKDAVEDLRDSRVAVAGAGGAARACIYALKNEGAAVTVFARKTTKAEALGKEFAAPTATLTNDDEQPTTNFSGFDILVNATPLGTKGEQENLTVATAEQLNGVRLVYDLVYNPSQTRLLTEAQTAGAQMLGGLEMLIGQGAEQFRIWTGESPPVQEMTEAVRKKLAI